MSPPDRLPPIDLGWLRKAEGDPHVDEQPEPATGVEAEPREPADTETAPASRVRTPPGRRLSAWYADLPKPGRILVWLALAAWLVLGVATFGTVQSRIRSGPGAPAASGRGTLALIALNGPDGAPPALALVHRGASRDVVLLPSGTLVELPGAGPRSLRAALSETGAEALGVSVANLLGVRVPAVLTGGPKEVEALVDALGGVPVSVPETIEVVQDGFVRTLFRRGRDRMNGPRFAEFLSLTVDGENELERVARQNAAWRALMDALARARADGPLTKALESWGGMEPDAALGLLRAVAADRDRTFHTLPVSSVGISQEDLYRLDSTQMRAIRVALGDVTPRRPGSAHRVRLLLSADGDLRAAVAAARLLVDEGYAIALTGRASKPYDQTLVVMAERRDEIRESARRLLDLVGVGRLGVDERPTSLFDVTLVIGSDWAAENGFS